MRETKKTGYMTFKSRADECVLNITSYFPCFNFAFECQFTKHDLLMFTGYITHKYSPKLIVNM